MSVKVLLIGNAADRHLIRLVNNIKASDLNGEIIFDILHTNPHTHFNEKLRLSEISGSIRFLFYVKRNFVSSLNAINVATRLIDILISLFRIKNNEYNIVNMHYMSPYYFLLWPFIKMKGRKTMISPWGSDVYRVSGVKAWMIRQCYKRTEYVSSVSDKFSNDIILKFHVSPKKFVHIGFGSIMDDTLFSNYNLTKEEAKRELGLSDNYVIVCGYNGSPSQQHFNIIKELSYIKAKLPKNYILLFPMTYVKQDNYINELKNLLDESLCPYKIYSDYLNDKELLSLRKCADIFIHVQTTDAFSASIQEFLLCDVTVINGDWVRYPDLERWGIPYLLINSVDELGEKVCKIVDGLEKVSIPHNLKLDILSRGYSSQVKKWIKFYTSFA